MRYAPMDVDQLIQIISRVLLTPNIRLPDMEADRHMDLSLEHYDISIDSGELASRAFDHTQGLARRNKAEVRVVLAFSDDG